MRLRRATVSRAAAGTCAAITLVLLAGAAPATAATPATPGGPYTGMGDCPLSNPTMRDPSNLQVGCTVSVTSSGSVTIGKITVPLTSPITLQFGVVWPS